MATMSQTCPSPDKPGDHLGPRERAMAVFKWLLDLDPHEAVRHEHFELIVNAFRQNARTTVRAALGESSYLDDEDLFQLREMMAPLESTEPDRQTKPRTLEFQTDQPRHQPRRASDD